MLSKIEQGKQNREAVLKALKPTSAMSLQDIATRTGLKYTTARRNVAALAKASKVKTQKVGRELHVERA